MGINFCCIILAGLCHCSGGELKEDTDEGAVRRKGQDYKPLGVEKFIDTPSVSSNGKKIVFISGKKGSLHAYKAESDIGAASIKATSLLEQGSIPTQVTSEIEVVISPDGGNVLLVGESSKDQLLSLYYLDWQGSNIQSVPQAQKYKKIDGLIFSPDSKLFSFIRSQENNRGFVERKLFIATKTGISLAQEVSLDGSWIELKTLSFVSLSAGGIFALVVYGVQQEDDGSYIHKFLKINAQNMGIIEEKRVTEDEMTYFDLSSSHSVDHNGDFYFVKSHSEDFAQKISFVGDGENISDKKRPQSYY